MYYFIADDFTICAVDFGKACLPSLALGKQASIHIDTVRREFVDGKFCIRSSIKFIDCGYYVI